MNCPHYSFQLDIIYKGRCPEVKERIIDRALSGATIGSAREDQACDA